MDGFNRDDWMNLSEAARYLGIERQAVFGNFENYHKYGVETCVHEGKKYIHAMDIPKIPRHPRVIVEMIRALDDEFGLVLANSTPVAQAKLDALRLEMAKHDRA